MNPSEKQYSYTLLSRPNPVCHTPMIPDTASYVCGGNFEPTVRDGCWAEQGGLRALAAAFRSEFSACDADFLLSLLSED
jgi:hypothetical protein